MTRLIALGVLLGSWIPAALPEAGNGIGIIDVATDAPSDLQVLTLEDDAFARLISQDRPTLGWQSIFASGDNKVMVDYSQYGTHTAALTDWGGDEFMFFIEGQVEITDSDGDSKVYGPGDMIVMPKGFTGTWRQLSPIRKISVTYDWPE